MFREFAENIDKMHYLVQSEVGKKGAKKVCDFAIFRLIIHNFISFCPNLLRFGCGLEKL